MELGFTSDAHEDTGVGDVTCDLSGPMRRHFEPRDYGSGAVGVFVVLMCRHPSIQFHRRLRYSRKDATIYMDIMLDYDWMVAADPVQRRAEVTARLGIEIAEVLAKYKFNDFDTALLLEDLRAWLSAAMQLPYRIYPQQPRSIAEYEREHGHLPPGNKIRR